MDSFLLLLLGALFVCSAVDGQFQRSYPYLSFLGDTLPDHAYVDISLIGVEQSGSDSVQCHTNLVTCCREEHGDGRGDWFTPDNNRLPFPTRLQLVFEDREEMRVDLRNRNASSPIGLYRCDIDVVGVGASEKKSLYVGLYTAGHGNVKLVSGGVTLNVISDLNGDTPQFTLTCISTGGPATTVIWTRDTVQFTEGSQESVLVDRVDAKYTHTLMVSGRPEGLYTCNISNNKPSHDSAQLFIEALPGVPEQFAAEEGERVVIFSWSPPKRTIYSGNITSYTLTCSPSPSSLPLTTSQSGMITLRGFSPNTLYSCSLSASNNRGRGQSAIVSFTTRQDYAFFQLHLSGIQTDCVQYKAENEQEKLSNVTDAVLSQLIASCSNCTVTSSGIIDEQYFFCDPESPTSVTYRARLEGIAERDSDDFLSIIESWVRTGPNVTAGVALLVNRDCSSSISSLTNPEEGVCQIPTTAPEEPLLSPQTIGIIAGVCGVIGLMVLITLVVILFLWCKYCCRYKTPPPEEKALEGLSGVYIAREKEKEKLVEEETGEQEHEISPQPVLKIEREEEKEDSMDTQLLEVTQDTDDREPVNEGVLSQPNPLSQLNVNTE